MLWRSNMIIISSRENFVDADHLAIKNEVRDIDLVSNQSLNNNIDLNKALLGKKVLILVHGYNNKQDEIYNAYKTIEDNVLKHSGSEYDQIVGYCWPGCDKGSEWWEAKSNVGGAAVLFFDLLKSLSDVCSVIDVMSHSLGAAVTLKALLKSILLFKDWFDTKSISLTSFLIAR
ncbi:MAG: alpha/beta hydrolase [Candidatus Electrothrix sp. AUS4]|nr:alpha/beta hydrolase [Candidatus Electrothrix sp. AUS4]